jgi:eukaryotic-like serine/threonine-protein kinase
VLWARVGNPLNSRICPHCGTKNEINASECAKCHRRFDTRTHAVGQRVVSAQATQILGQIPVTPSSEIPAATQLIYPTNSPNTITPPQGSTPSRGSSDLPTQGYNENKPAPHLPVVSRLASAPQIQAAANPISEYPARPTPLPLPISPPIPQALPPIPPLPAPVVPSSGLANIVLDELSQLSPDDLNSRDILIGNYKLTRLLGQGGMGAVYLGEHVEIGKRAAVKILKPELAKDKESIARFLSEARLITRLRHPSIVDVYDCGVYSRVGRYLIMEYLEGDDLYTYLKRKGALSPAEAASIGWQILDALEAAHDAGVIHRDLKPPNIYLVRWGRRTLVKLLDFGVAKLLDTSKEDALLTRTGVVVGTPAYMAPEQAAGGKEPDGRLDLYSFGVIMFELVTGRRPFLSNNVNEILVMQQVEPAPMPSAFAPGLPKPLEQLILRCLEKSPADRPANARVLKEELGAIMGNLPTVPLAIEAIKNVAKQASNNFPEINTADIAPLLAPDEPVFGAKGTQPPENVKNKEDSKDLHAVLSSNTGLSSTAQRLKAAGALPQKQSISNSFKELQALRAQVTGDNQQMLARMSANELDAVAKYGATVAVRSPSVARRKLKSLVMAALILGTISFLALLGLGGYFLWRALQPPQPNIPTSQPSNPTRPEQPIMQQVVLDSIPRGATITGMDGKVISKTPFTFLVPQAGLKVQLSLEKYIGTEVQLRQSSEPQVIQLMLDVPPVLTTPEKAPIP